MLQKRLFMFLLGPYWQDGADLTGVAARVRVFSSVAWCQSNPADVHNKITRLSPAFLSGNLRKFCKFSHRKIKPVTQSISSSAPDKNYVGIPVQIDLQMWFSPSAWPIKSSLWDSEKSKRTAATKIFQTRTTLFKAFPWCFQDPAGIPASGQAR